MRMALPLGETTPSEEADTPAAGMAETGLQSSSALTVEQVSASLKGLKKKLDQLPEDSSLELGLVNYP